MATTYLYPGKYYPISGGITPILVLPGGTGHPDAAAQGDSITVEFVSSIHNTGTVDTGSADIRNPNTGLVITSPMTLKAARETYTFVYNSIKSQWEILTSHKFRTENSVYGTFDGDHALATLPSLTTLPISYIIGDQDRFSIASNIITADIRFDDPIIMTFDIAGVMSSGSVNKEVQIHGGFRVTGSGGFSGFDAIHPFQTFNTGAWEWKIEGTAIWTPRVGDTLKVVAAIASFSDMDANASDILVRIDGS
jgi:hypothetical protein